MDEVSEEEANMKLTKLVVDGVLVIELRPAQYDAAKVSRDPSEQEYLQHVLRDLDLQSDQPPLIVDLTRLEEFTGWELADFVKIMSQVILWKFEALVVITYRTSTQIKLRKQYGSSIRIFPSRNAEAITTAAAFHKAREVKLRAS